MLDYKTTKKFDKDVKKLIKQGKQIEKLQTTMALLIAEKDLSEEYKLHPLEPKNLNPKRWDVHSNGRNSDWILIFYYYEGMIIFERTGSHSDLFK